MSLRTRARTSGPAGSVFPLADLTATAAYSLRRTRAGYTGSLVRVRRSSDNVEADIGFTVAGDLDTAALLAHTGANSGFVVTWYDQSGNARNATQAVQALQPRIVNAGAVEQKNARPTIRAHVAPTSLPVWKFAAPSTAFSYNIVMSRDTAATNTNDVAGLDGAGFTVDGVYVQMGLNFARTIFNRAAALTEAISPLATLLGGQNAVTTLTHTAGNVAQQSLNGALGAATAPMTWVSGASSNFSLGDYAASASLSLLGTYQEFISFGSALTTPELLALERNQGAYFGVGVA